MANKQALLVIDMLNDFVLDSGKLTCGKASQAIIPAIIAQASEARKKAIPVLYVCDNHLPDDQEFKLYPPHCITGTEGAQIVSELRPATNDFIIPKRRYNGFFETQLDLTLRELDVKELIITGVCTNICVFYTAADARMRGYDIIIPKSCVASFDLQAHEFALREMEKIIKAQILG